MPTSEEVELAIKQEIYLHNELVKAGHPKAKPITNLVRWCEPKRAELMRKPERVRARVAELRARLAAEELAKLTPAPEPKPMRVVDPFAWHIEMQKLKKSLEREELEDIEQVARQELDDEGLRWDKNRESAVSTRVLEIIDRRHGQAVRGAT